MDRNFWHLRWENNEIGFHESTPNPLLVKHFNALSPTPGSRVFVPLCGKTLDISWFLSHGYRVAGAELSQKAVEQLFEDLRVEPEVTDLGGVKRYSGPHIDIFVGDIFEVSRPMLGGIDAVYDRAALVALPPEMRQPYTAHLMEITAKAPQLVVCYVYDQTLMEGPPFSISNEEIREHYQADYTLSLLETAEVPGGFKGKFPSLENVWLLTGR
ncbi:MAG: thiopurine S-methyltransferase [Blastocatellia bacterium]|nr:thiopurine S-methyltransferase [Blastocatellia bacterium]